MYETQIKLHLLWSNKLVGMFGFKLAVKTEVKLEVKLYVKLEIKLGAKILYWPSSSAWTDPYWPS